jgi:uncharacterized protein YdbL (DUF1318 family)
VIAQMVMVPLQTTHAQQPYQIQMMTPPVKSALDGRKSRYDQLTRLKDQGKVGEANNGYVWALVDGESIAALVAAENRDREVIYRAMVEQNQLDGALSMVQSVFAQVQRERAEPGHKIQTVDGRWITKE